MMDDKKDYQYNKGKDDDESADLTHVPVNLAHQTKKKTPPQPPPARHSTAVPTVPIPTIDLTEPPTYSDTYGADDNFYSNDINIDVPIDSEIQNRLGFSLNQHIALNHHIPDYENELPETEKYIPKPIDYYTDISKMVRKASEPGVLLPLRGDLFESYLAGLLSIFSQVPRFNNIVLSHQFLTLPYKPNWWNREKCSENPLLYQELQRLIAFLNYNSNRSFSSIYNLVNCLSKLQTSEIDSLSEFQHFAFSEILALLIKNNHHLKADCENLFKMVCFAEDNFDETHDIFTIPIQVDTVKPSLYETIHNCFFQSDNRILLMNISDIVPITFESGMNNLNIGLKVEEKIYPQIYTYDNANILLNIEDKIQEIKLKQQELGQKSLKLRAFNNRSVHGFLNDAKNYLKNESINMKDDSKLIDVPADSNTFSEKDKYSAASQSIEIVASHIRETVKQIENEQKFLNDKISMLNASKYDINQLLTPEMKANFEPWILTGVMFNAAQFYYREKKGYSWISISINDETCKEFIISRLEINEIINNVQLYTEEDFGDGMVLIYVKESTFYKDDFSPLNRTLQDFITKDNVKLREQLSTLELDDMIFDDSKSNDPFQDP